MACGTSFLAVVLMLNMKRRWIWGFGRALIVMGLFHGHTVANTVDELTARSWPETFAPSLLMLLVLIPMISFDEIDRSLGKGRLRRMLFGRTNSDEV